MTGTRRAVLIAGLILMICSSLVLAQDKDKDDQPGALTVHIRDYCDPVTFANIGCVRTATPLANGLITLPGFGAELAADKSVGAWRFIPDHAKAGDGLNLMLKNLGGEMHT